MANAPLMSEAEQAQCFAFYRRLKAQGYCWRITVYRRGDPHKPGLYGAYVGETRVLTEDTCQRVVAALVSHGYVCEVGVHYPAEPRPRAKTASMSL